MKAILVFTLLISAGFWAADQFCFDGEYSENFGNEAMK
jgi:hypothetical protein